MSISRLRPRFATSGMEAAAQIAGLLATGWVVWDIALAGRGDLLVKIASGFILSCGVWAWAALMVLALRLVMRYLANQDAPPVKLRALAVGVWFAPATLLMIESSVVGVTAALVLTVSATRLLTVPPPAAEVPPWRAVAVLDAGELPIDLLAHHFGAALLVAAGLQGVLALGLAGHRTPAAALFLLSAAIFTALAIGLGAWVQKSTPNLPRSILGLCLTVLLALLGVRMGGGGSGWGSGQGSGNVGDAGYPTRPGAGSHPPGSPERVAANLNLPGSFPGVILWPEVRPVTLLIAPLPVGHGPSTVPAHPLRIPFGGEYWMYRLPFQHPPPNSFFLRGTPTRQSFSTTDLRPLNMEAHQKLEQAVSLGCCHSIDVQILNGDRAARYVSLELLVHNAASGKVRVLSLGMSPLKSVPGTKDDQVAPVEEMLSFAVPAARPFEDFDELEVRFVRLLGRNHSARIAIEGFVLVP